MTAFACVIVVVLAIAFPGISLPILDVALLATPMIVLAAVCYACCRERLWRRRFLMSVFGYYAIMSAYLILNNGVISTTGSDTIMTNKPKNTIQIAQRLQATSHKPQGL